jgi:hypothetical protein
VHALGEEQETAASEVNHAPDALGALCTVQAAPSQCYTKAEPPLTDPADSPTAKQSLEDEQKTPLRELPVGWLGVGTTFQLVPFQCSTSGFESPAPTAIQSAAELHDTAARLAMATPTGLGNVIGVQLAPSQRSTSAGALPEPGIAPTAMQNRVLTQLIPSSVPRGTSGPAGH